MKILYFAPIYFDDMKQRPQQLAECLARKHEVYYIEPTVSRIRWMLKKGRSYRRYRKKISDTLTVIRLSGRFTFHKSVEILDLPGCNNWSEYRQIKQLADQCDLIWTGYAGWYTLVRHLKGKPIVYDKMDEEDLLARSWLLKLTLRRNKKKLAKISDLVFASCAKFYEEFRDRKPVCLAPNALSEDFIMHKRNMQADYYADFRKESADKQEIRKEPADKQEIRKEPVDKQEIRKEPADKQGIRKEPVDKQGIRKEPVDKQGIRKEPVDKQEIRKEPADKQGIRKEAADKQGIRKEAADKQRIRKDTAGRLVFGYVGTIGEWFDFEALRCILSCNKRYEVVLAGRNLMPVFRHKRVTYLGVRPHEELPELISSFDVCLYNFKRNKLLDTINPVKIYEYLAMQKPVLAVKSRETVKLERYVMTYREASQIAALLAAGIRRPFSSQEEYEVFIACNTWESRAAVIEEALERLARQRALQAKSQRSTERNESK